MNDEPLFDRLGIGMRIALFIVMIVLLPLWFPIMVIQMIFFNESFVDPALDMEQDEFNEMYFEEIRKDLE